MEFIQSLIPRNQANTILYSGLAAATVLGLLAMRSRKVMINTTKNRYIIHEDEVIPGVSYYSHREDQIKHLVITGDWYSIWLLCYYFIVAEQPVQPIYFMDTTLPGELAKYKAIRERLVKQFPHKQARLLPTYYVINTARHLDTSRYIHHLLNKESSGAIIAGSREYTVFELATRFSTEYPWPILLGATAGSGFAHLLGSEQIRLLGEWDLAMPICPDGLLNNIRFPIIHLPIEKLTQISLDSRNFFYDYVKT